MDDTVLADLNETYGSAVSAVRRPVNPPPAPVTGDEDPSEPQTTSELTTVEKLERKAREEAILKRHDDFANDLNEAEEMSASRQRVSLDLNEI